MASVLDIAKSIALSGWKEAGCIGLETYCWELFWDGGSWVALSSKVNLERDEGGALHFSGTWEVSKAASTSRKC